MWLIVGLGNPGKEYEWSRHNLGFLLIDKLAEDGITVGRRECSSLVGKGELERVPVLLAKPQTYMNLSGEAVSCLRTKARHDERFGQLVVISDDLALPLGNIRIRERGSAGGHNGLKSIIGALGTNEFTRLRIGIAPAHPISDTRKFVLDSFSKAERVVVKDVLEKSSAAVKTIIRDGVLKAMSEFN